jgi:carbamoyltransferase
LKATRRSRNPVVVRRYDHHLTHAALASYTSPFDHCTVAVIDGYGENRSTSFFRFASGKLTGIPNQRCDSPAEIRQHISLGHFYARLCALCGFDPLLGEEWKVMGLAGYGALDAQVRILMKSLIGVEGLNLRAVCPDDVVSRALEELQTFARRGDEPSLKCANLAFTGQHAFEETMTELLIQLHKEAPDDNLALCGGCALNSSCNGRILEQTPFRRLHVPSAPADDGCALGAALLAFKEDQPDASLPSDVASPYLGSCVPAVALDHLERFGGFLSIRRT